MSVKTSHRQIPITKPLIGSEEAVRVREVLESGWLTQGKMVAAFEEIVKKRVGASHAVATSSCTTSLHLALMLVGLKAGDLKPEKAPPEIICPSYSFVATANVALYLNAKPVFADIDPKTQNMDPAHVESLISERTRAIIAVHQLGQPCDLDRIYAIGKKHGIPIIEDAACALGASYHGKPIGSHGPLVCFSFHPRKAVTSAEGGILATSHAEFASLASQLRSHGASITDLARHSKFGTSFESYNVLGFNFRMSDVHAAIGIEQMKRLDPILKRRTEISEFYNRMLGELPEMELRHCPKECGHSWQTYAFVLSAKARISRDEFLSKMAERGVSCRRGIPCIHEQSYIVERVGQVRLPHTERISQQSVFLPLYPQMTEDDMQYVIQMCKECL